MPLPLFFFKLISGCKLAVFVFSAIAFFSIDYIVASCQLFLSIQVCICTYNVQSVFLIVHCLQRFQLICFSRWSTIFPRKSAFFLYNQLVWPPAPWHQRHQRLHDYGYWSNPQGRILSSQQPKLLESTHWLSRPRQVFLSQHQFANQNINVFSFLSFSMSLVKKNYLRSPNLFNVWNLNKNTQQETCIRNQQLQTILLTTLPTTQRNTNKQHLEIYFTGLKQYHSIHTVIIKKPKQ